ncbi:XdhC family protein [Novipirellula artificiosorum]|uniref:Putative xanthine dehydrogenase subunit A n=1 Tax=Novipirellula artificiosorum TaxID=2528016 RepID=A0A5C6DLF8_9BACT|nr:XdhC/CoxI family protein [Novipirellula artificiosorum]TWU38233.1 putative xanthine dehydrogenase subunit A [Novipirellula artificiosorum]
MHNSYSIDDLHRTIATIGDDQHLCALAVVMAAEGPVPAKLGSKAVLTSKHVLSGTIGGGWVEAATLQRVAEALETGHPLVLEFNLAGHAATEGHPICGGSLRVLLTPLNHALCNACRAAANAAAERQRGVLVTHIRCGGEVTVETEFFLQSALASHDGFPDLDMLRQVVTSEQNRLFHCPPDPKGCDAFALVEPVLPKPLLLIVGGGHIGQALAMQADGVGFDLAVFDDRPEFTQPELFPNSTALYGGNVVQQLKTFPCDSDCYIVIATRGHQQDAAALAACMKQAVAYIGMIGSRRKVAMLRKELTATGCCTVEQFDRIYAPIGLDIGAETVPEIAASIVAQLIQVRRTSHASRL